MDRERGRWFDRGPESRDPDPRIAKHASRTLIKAGDPAAIALFAFDTKVKVRVDELHIASKKLELGDTLEFSFTVASEAARAQHS